MKQKLVKYLFISDLQIPDQNREALEAVFSFIPDFKPDEVHIVGDFLNFTAVSNYTSVNYHIDLATEIEEGREILDCLVKTARYANDDVKFIWFDGNHEHRLLKFLASNASEIGKLTINGEQIVSIPHLFEFKKLKIKYIPYLQGVQLPGNVLVEHGDIARAKAGYTAHGMLDKRGQSGISGHTHRLAYVARKQGNRQSFWIELGSLCNLDPTPHYINTPDWVNGFAIGHYYKDIDTFYPTLIPIINNSFSYNGRLYQAERS